MQFATSELEGAALDWAVAKAERLPVFFCTDRTLRGNSIDDPWTPSTDWGQGGPLLEKYQVELQWIGIDGKAIAWNASHEDVAEFQCAKTPLIAAMRAIVASVIGDSVEVPDELV